MKDFLRKKYLQLRQDLGDVDIVDKSSQIFSKILQIEEFKEVETIGIYLDIPGEVKTSNIISYFIAQRTKVFVPSFKRDEWKFARYISGGNLEKGPFGIPQPKDDEFIAPYNLEAIFVPGVAFSEQGYRIGYGKGVYDRLLNNVGGLVVGLCFDIQIVDEQFHEKHDHKVDMIISENRIFKIPKHMT